MKPTILTFLLCIFGLNNMTNCTAQNDPFGPTASTNQQTATVSPSQLPSFEDYRKNPGDVTVKPVFVKRLVGELKATNKKQIIIIDARSAQEYEISHIQNSRRVGYEDFSTERIWMLSRESRMIVYSASKNRSTVVAQYLKLMGFSHVEVLEEGLIGWKNEKNDIYDADGITNKIHVGSKNNAKLVKNGQPIH